MKKVTAILIFLFLCGMLIACRRKATNEQDGEYSYEKYIPKVGEAYSNLEYEEDWLTGNLYVVGTNSFNGTELVIPTETQDGKPVRGISLISNDHVNCEKLVYINQSAGSEFFLGRIRGGVKKIVIVAETITLDQRSLEDLDFNLESVTLIGKNIKFSSEVFLDYHSYPEIHMYGMTESDNYTIVERNGIRCSGRLLFANGTIVLDERAIEADSLKKIDLGSGAIIIDEDAFDIPDSNKKIIRYKEKDYSANDIVKQSVAIDGPYLGIDNNSLIGQWEFAGVIRHRYDNEFLTLSGLIANKESGIWFGELYEEETLSYFAEHSLVFREDGTLVWYPGGKTYRWRQDWDAVRLDNSTYGKGWDTDWFGEFMICGGKLYQKGIYSGGITVVYRKKTS